MYVKCKVCGEKKELSKTLGVCVDCIRYRWGDSEEQVLSAHRSTRTSYNLPPKPPRREGGIKCNFCVNECSLGDGDVSYCGLRMNRRGKLESLTTLDKALVYTYLDPHPTNCCAAYFCPGGTGAGYPEYAYTRDAEYGYYNYSVFLYGCSFDCLFCQNHSHKEVITAPEMGVDEFIEDVLSREKVSCVCFFGGTPEPQLPFALKASRFILEGTERPVRICWEWNGSGNEILARRAAYFSLVSGGNVKFDLKAATPELSVALSGVSNERAYKNFEAIYHRFYCERRDLPVLNATTLLVPHYVDASEVENIARFISDLDPEIPYSLLLFYPHYMMRDLPLTPLRQVEECLRVARRHLRRVHLGNIHLLHLSGRYVRLL